mgnify:CR=1 FL=1
MKNLLYKNIKISLICILFLINAGDVSALEISSDIATEMGEVFEEILKPKSSSDRFYIEDKTQNKMQTIVSPYVNRSFDIEVDENSSEYHMGKYKVICPYSGKAFFIGKQSLDKEEAKLVKKNIRSPFTGDIFSAEIDLDSMLTNDSQEMILTCPYTGRDFRFSMNPISKEDSAKIKREGFVMVLDPLVNKYFKVFSTNGDFSKTVLSPYTGKEIKIPKDGEEDKKDSEIEKMFNKSIVANKYFDPIKQFAYNLFPKKSHLKDFDTESGNAGFASKSTLGLELGALQSLTKGKTNKINFLSADKKERYFETTDFAPVTSVPVSPDYILGPDDTLIINIWGKTQQSIEITIDRNGKIILPESGALYLWGQTFAEAKELIKNALNKYYTNISIDITMGELRTIRVFIFGNIVRPGSYILSSRATAFHAIFNALGPSKSGSLRDITIKRKNNELIVLDLYDLFLSGDKSKDVRLESDDIIFVNPIRDVIGIAGEVNTPAIYEIKEPILLQDFIAMAGGILPIADMSNIKVVGLNKF